MEDYQQDINLKKAVNSNPNNPFNGVSGSPVHSVRDNGFREFQVHRDSPAHKVKIWKRILDINKNKKYQREPNCEIQAIARASKQTDFHPGRTSRPPIKDKSKSKNQKRNIEGRKRKLYLDRTLNQKVSLHELPHLIPFSSGQC